MGSVKTSTLPFARTRSATFLASPSTSVVSPICFTVRTYTSWHGARSAACRVFSGRRSPPSSRGIGLPAHRIICSTAWAFQADISSQAVTRSRASGGCSAAGDLRVDVASVSKSTPIVRVCREQSQQLPLPGGPLRQSPLQDVALPSSFTSRGIPRPRRQRPQGLCPCRSNRTDRVQLATQSSATGGSRGSSMRCSADRAIEAAAPYPKWKDTGISINVAGLNVSSRRRTGSTDPTGDHTTRPDRCNGRRIP